MKISFSRLIFNINYRTVGTFLILLVLSVFLISCTQFQQTLTADEKSFPATKIEDMQLFFSAEKPTRPYKEVGSIVATEGNEKTAMAFLKKKAALMGADALLNSEVRVHTYVILILFIPIPQHNYIASGIAVKYTD